MSMGLHDYDGMFEADRARHGGSGEVSMPWLDSYRQNGSPTRTRQPVRDRTRAPGAEHARGQKGEPVGRHPDSGRGERGGTGGAGSASPSEPPGGREEQFDELLDEDAAPVVSDGSSAPAAGLSEDGLRDDIDPVPLRLTDHQEAVQAAAAASAARARRVSRSGDAADLPRTGFKVIETSAQPHVRNLPESLVGRLREQLTSVIVRELGVDHADAEAFSLRLSQGSLVTAFLMAQLDVPVEVDPATARAAALFRQRDSLLGSVVERLEHLETIGEQQKQALQRVRQEVQAAGQTSAVVEHGVAYLLADRVENLGHGVNSAADMDLGHRSALVARDRAREETGTQQRLARERAGRPIR